MGVHRVTNLIKQITNQDDQWQSIGIVNKYRWKEKYKMAAQIRQANKQVRKGQ